MLLTRDEVAELIWVSEYLRSTGRDRNIPWSEVSEENQNRYLYQADMILAAEHSKSTHPWKWPKTEHEG